MHTLAIQRAHAHAHTHTHTHTSRRARQNFLYTGKTPSCIGDRNSAEKLLKSFKKLFCAFSFLSSIFLGISFKAHLVPIPLTIRAKQLRDDADANANDADDSQNVNNELNVH